SVLAFDSPEESSDTNQRVSHGLLRRVSLLREHGPAADAPDVPRPAAFFSAMDHAHESHRCEPHPAAAAAAHASVDAAPVYEPRELRADVADESHEPREPTDELPGFAGIGVLPRQPGALWQELHRGYVRG
ncbi:unnamed protein product, partial [Effrenium voratum]